MCAARLLSPLLALAHTAFAWQCSVPGGFTLTVSEDAATAYNYSVALSGLPWLEGGSYALHSGGAFFAPGAGLSTSAPPTQGEASGDDDPLGAYTYLSIAWVTDNGVPFDVNFTCYASGASFTGGFPQGLPQAALLAFAAPGTAAPLGAGTAAPSTHFPSFAANPGSFLLADSTAYAEWYGCMSAGGGYGRGLAGWRGGQQAGPLLLLDAAAAAPGDPARAKPPALVLGPLDEFGSAILGKVERPGRVDPIARLRARHAHAQLARVLRAVQRAGRAQLHGLRL